MNTILLAAARGARIETQYQYPKKHWGVVQGIRSDNFYPYRIHKDDDHLRFGPISTALRESAVKASLDEPLTLPTKYGNWWLNMVDYREYQDCRSELHRSLFLLILSECLCDEGL